MAGTPLDLPSIAGFGCVIAAVALTWWAAGDVGDAFAEEFGDVPALHPEQNWEGRLERLEEARRKKATARKPGGGRAASSSGLNQNDVRTHRGTSK